LAAMRPSSVRCAERESLKPSTFSASRTSALDHASGGSFVIGRKTIKKRMRAKLEAIKVELRKRMHDPIATTRSWVKQVLQGHLNYYAVSGNHPSLWWFCNQVRWYWLPLHRFDARTRARSPVR